MDITCYRERRENLLGLLKGSFAIIRSGVYKTRSHDTDFPFRQESIFQYFTGFSGPDSILVLTPALEQKCHLFVRPKDEKMEQWTGKRMGVEKAKSTLGIDSVYSIDCFKEEVIKLMPGHKKVYDDLFGDPKNTNDMLLLMKKVQLINRKKPTFIPTSLGDIRALTKKMRLIKDPSEIQFIKKACQATEKAHLLAMALAAPGVNESEVAALIEYIFKKEGAQASAYESIVAGGDNANVLHYISNNKKLIDGDLLLIDAGAEFNLYASDVTRTFPINGRFTGIQKDVYQLVLDSQKACINMSLPKKSLTMIDQEAKRILTEGLIELKVLSGSLDENIEKGHYKKYYPHGTGHWLGMDVHDECHYLDDDNNDILLEQGMVFTVEPGLYFPKSDPTIRAELQGIGIRIEDDILITKTGHEVMTSQIPKEVKEIEEACKQEFILKGS